MFIEFTPIDGLFLVGFYPVGDATNIEINDLILVKETVDQIRQMLNTKGEEINQWAQK
jgi:hypothetical protein